MAAPSEPSRPRTLTEALRAMSADELATLLSARPDLLEPIPEDITELASRSTTSASINHVIDQLNCWLRTVAEALAALADPAAAGDLETMLGSSPAHVGAAVQQLREHGLLWGHNDQMHLVRPVREAFEPYPGGLAPPSARPMSNEQIDAALQASGAEARLVLERLLWSPTGSVRHADRKVTVASASSPIERLLSRQLLRPLDSETVIIPREVAWRLRGARFAPEPVPTEAPVITGRYRDPDRVDQAAAGAAFALLHDIELLAHRLESVPHKLLRAGGLANRDVTALAQHLGADPAHAVFVIECAAAARLVAPAGSAALLPTADYDQWLGCDAPTRWRLVAGAWLSADRFFARSAVAGGHPLGVPARGRRQLHHLPLALPPRSDAGAGARPAAARRDQPAQPRLSALQHLAAPRRPAAVEAGRQPHRRAAPDPVDADVDPPRRRRSASPRRTARARAAALLDDQLACCRSSPTPSSGTTSTCSRSSRMGPHPLASRAMIYDVSHRTIYRYRRRCCKPARRPHVAARQPAPARQGPHPADRAGADHPHASARTTYGNAAPS